MVRVGAIVGALTLAAWSVAQSQPSSKQYVVLVKPGPKWVPGKPAEEQGLGSHARYLQAQMTKGVLQWAGEFLDNTGGLILYKARDEAEARGIAEHDPGVVAGILAVGWIRPFDQAFDAASGKSPFNARK